MDCEHIPTLEDEIDLALHAIAVESDRIMALINQQIRRGAE